MSYLFVGLLSLLIALISFQCKSILYYEFTHIPQSIYLQSISLFCLALFWFKHSFQSDKKIQLSYLYLPMVGLLGWVFLSLVWAVNPAEGFAIALNWLAAGLLFFVIFNSIEHVSHIKLFLWCSLLPLTFICIVGISQVLELPYFLFYPQIIAPAVTFGNKNMMVDVLVTLLPMALLLFFICQSLWLRVSGLSLFGVGVILILLSNTRAGMLALVVQVFFLFFLLLLKRREFHFKMLKTPAFVSAPLVLFLLIGLIYFKNDKVRNTGVGEIINLHQASDRLLSIFKTKESDQWALKKDTADSPLNVISDSRTMRLVTWQNTLMMIKDRPFTGVGLYNWKVRYGEYRTAWFNDPVYRPGMLMDQVHNDYLQLLADLGLVGALFVLSIFAFNVQSFLMIMRYGQSKDIQITVLIGTAMVGLLVVSFFSFPFERAVPVTLYFVHTALLAAYRRFLPNVRQDKTIGISKKVSVVFACLIASGFVTSCFYQNKRLAAEVEFKSANDQYALGNYKLAIQYLDKVLLLTPYRHTAEFLLGYSYLNLNQDEKAIEYLSKGLKYYPNDLNSLLLIGTAYTRLTLQSFLINREINSETKELLGKSDYWFQRALSIRTDLLKVYYNKAVLLQQKANYASAQERQEIEKDVLVNYKKTVEIDSNYVDGLVAIARFYNNKKEYTDAIIYAQKAVDILLKNFRASEDQLIKFEKNEVSTLSRAYLEMGETRRKNRRILLGNLMEMLGILKAYYGAISVDISKYLEILEFEEVYYLAKEVEVKEQEAYAKQTLAATKDMQDADSKILKSLQEEYNQRLAEMHLFALEKQKAIGLLLLNKVDAKCLLGKYDEALTILKSLLVLTEKEYPNQDASHILFLMSLEKHAHIQIADVLCTMATINYEGKVLNIPLFKKLLPEIEENLRQGEVDISDGLAPKFKKVYDKVESYKSALQKMPN